VNITCRYLFRFRSTWGHTIPKWTAKPQPEVVIGASLRKNRIFWYFFWVGLNLNIFQCFSFQWKWPIFSVTVADVCAYKMPQKIFIPKCT